MFVQFKMEVLLTVCQEVHCVGNSGENCRIEEWPLFGIKCRHAVIDLEKHAIQLGEI